MCNVSHIVAAKTIPVVFIAGNPNNDPCTGELHEKGIGVIGKNKLFNASEAKNLYMLFLITV